MPHPIIVPLDASPLAEHALVPAVGIAARIGAPLHLVRARDHDSPDDGDGALGDDEYLQDLARRLHGEIAPHRLTLAELSGTAADSVAAYAKRVNAWLVVMASRRHDGIHENVFSSVTDRVIRVAGLPVLVCGPETTPVERESAWQCRRILVPLDGSAKARQVVRPAANIARAFGARITLLRVFPEPAHTVGWPAVPFSREQDAILEQAEGLAQLQDLAALLHDAGIDADARVLRSPLPVAEALAGAAFDYGADLIAISTRGRGVAARLAFGSVAHDLVRQVLTPMLVLGPGDLPAGEPFSLDLDAG